jgi:hypothetical protein
VGPPAHSEPKRCTLIRGDTGGEGNNKCLCVGFSTCPPSQPPPWTGEEPRLLPTRGEGWGGGYAQISLQRHLPIARPKFTIYPPPSGSPRYARGTAHGFGSPCSRGNLKEGVINCHHLAASPSPFQLPSRRANPLSSRRGRRSATTARRTRRRANRSPRVGASTCWRARASRGAPVAPSTAFLRACA